MPELKKEDFDQKDKSGISEAFDKKYGKPLAFGYTADIYRKDGKAIKVFSREFGKDLVFKEALCMSCAEYAGIKTARILSVRCEEGFWITESEYIDGTDQLKEIFAASIADDIDKVHEVVRKITILQADINRRTSPRLPRYKDNARKIICANEHLSQVCREKTVEYLEKLPDGDGIMHGDFHPQNVLVDKNGEMYVIDWVEAGSAPLGADAARTLMNYLVMPPVPPLMNPKLRLAQTFMTTYMDETGISKEDIEVWLPVHAAINYGEKADWYNEGIKQYLL